MIVSTFPRTEEFLFAFRGINRPRLQGIMPNLRHTPSEAKPPTGAAGPILPTNAPPASTVSISVQGPVANPSEVSAPIQPGLRRIAPEFRQQLSPPPDSLQPYNTGGRGPNPEQIQNMERAQTQIIQKTEDYTSEELGNMVSYLLRNPMLEPVIHTLWQRMCTPRQQEQLREKERIFKKTMQFVSSQGEPVAASSLNVSNSVENFYQSDYVKKSG